jgi:processing peptidase subunit beta
MALALARGLTARGLATPNAAYNVALRPFAAAADLMVADEAFTKWTNPVPQNYIHTNILAGPDTKVTTLKSGLRVATETTPYASTATVGVWIDAGSRFETASTNGTAHFLEHLAFKGTTARSKQQLEEEVENLGAHLNAYTSREQTTYYAKVLKADVPKAVEILADILQNSTLTNASVSAERDVILREMEEVEGVKEEVLFDHLHATAFQHSPLGRSILGPAENVRSITKGDLSAYIAAHYTAPRMVVVGAGGVDHDELVKLVEGSFSKLPTSSTTAASLVAASPSTFTGSEIRFRDDDMGTCHFAVAVKGASWNDPDAVTLMVMQAMLGAWDENSSAGVNVATPLGQRLSANKLCHSYMAFNTNYCDTGLFGVSAVAQGGQHLEDLVWCIMQEFTGLVYSVDDEDVVRAQNALKSSLTLHLDGSSPVAEDIGRQMLTYGRRIPKAELFARIDAVTADHVKAAAFRFIHDKDVATVSMGACQFVPDYNWIRRRTYWNRF